MKFILTSDLHSGFSHNTIKIHQKFFKAMSEDPVLKEEGFKGLIVAGDLISHNQKSLKTIFRTIRENLKCPVYVVWGNHDFWDADKKYRIFKNCYEEIALNRQKLCTEFLIHDLNYGSMRFPGEKVMLHGLNSWYWMESPVTNDLEHMKIIDDFGKPIHNTLRAMAVELFEADIEFVDMNTDHKHILVTHFPSYLDDSGSLRKGHRHCGMLEWMDRISKSFDIYCYGHSHRYVDTQVGKCRVYNAGSDYDKPAYKVFEI